MSTPDEDGTTIKRLPALRDKSGYIRGYLQYLSFDVPMFFRVLFGPGADVYICEPPPTSGVVVRVAAFLRRTPYVYYAADIWSDASSATGAPSFILAAVRMLETWALRGAAQVLAVSEGVSDRVQALAPGVATVVVGHGVDLETFCPEGSASEKPADIVYVGTASEWHGAEVAMEGVVRALKTDPMLTAAFVGQGSSWLALQEIAERNQLAERIQFSPPVSAEKAAEWLRSARVSIATLAPGQGYDFAVPTKIYASIAVGTPVVYAGPDPVRSLIEDEDLGAGVAYDTEAFAEALRGELRKAPRAEAVRLHEWARAHVSAESVANRSVSAVLGNHARAQER